MRNVASNENLAFASTLQISPAKAAVLICVLNGSQVVGQIALGWVSDWVNVYLLLTVSTFGSAAIAGVLWYMARSFNWLLIFSMLFGLFAGGYSVLWAGFNAALTDNPATGLWLYGLLAFQRGLGNILAGPISVALLKLTSKYENPDQPAAYKPTIIFVVITLLISSLGGMAHFSPQRQRSTTPKPRT
jgi:MFS family permease